MRLQKFRINIPAFKQFLYSMLYNASLETARIIPPRLHKFIKKQSEAKRFVQNANLDEALALLSYLGIEHFLVLVDKDVTTIEALRGILDKFKDDKKIAAVKDIIEKKLFVTSDKEFITLLGLAAQTIHHGSYSMNLEYTRTGYHIKKWARRFQDGQDDTTQEVQENSGLLAQTLLSSSLTLQKADILFQLQPLDVQLLLYLYPVKHTYVPAEQLYHYFGGQIPKSKVSVAIKNLVRHQYVHRSAIAKNDQLTLSGSGVRVVDQFMEATLHGNSFR